MPVLVAALQCPTEFGQVERNLARLTADITAAAQRGAQLVVVPEASLTGYVTEDLRTHWHLPDRPLAAGLQGVHPQLVAQTVPGPATAHFAKLAQELGIYLTANFVERAGAAYFNAMCLFTPAGEIGAHYRKLHPYPLAEDSWASPGDLGLQTCDTPFGKVGLAICYDVHFVLPEYRAEKLWALLFASAWVDVRPAQHFFQGELPAQLPDLGYHMIVSNWSTTRPVRWHGPGSSVILAKTGEVLASAQKKVGSECVLASLPTAKASGRN